MLTLTGAMLILFIDLAQARNMLELRGALQR